MLLELCDIRFLSRFCVFVSFLCKKSHASGSNLPAPLSSGNNPINSLNSMEMMGLKLETDHMLVATQGMYHFQT